MFIGTIEQIDIKSVLRRIETYGKTGQLLVKQEKQWVEMYFRGGNLMTVGPVHLYGNLGERLCQTGVISVLALQEALQVIGSAQPSEMRIALTLMDLGYVKNEDLRAWAVQSFSEVLQQLLLWPAGQIYFEENVIPPTDRLLVALSLSTLLASLDASTVSPAQQEQSTASSQSANPTPAPMRKPTRLVKSPFSLHVTNAPTLSEPSQFIPDYEPKAPAGDAPLMPQLEPAQTSGTIAASALLAPINTDTPKQGFSFLDVLAENADEQPARTPTKIKRAHRIDTTFMQPDMLLVPANIHAAQEQDVQIELTPEQWRVLTLVDGSVTLKNACQALMLHPDTLCQIVGELLSLGLISVGYMYAAPASAEAMQQQPVAMPLTAQAPFIQGQALSPQLPPPGRPMALAGMYAR